MTTATMGHQTALAVDDETPFDGSSQPLSFIRESIQLRTSHIDPDGVRGTRSHIKENVVEGVDDVGGQLSLVPSPEELAWLLPKILGASASGTTFALAETIPEFVMQFDRTRSRFLYGGCKINRATFRSSSGQPLELTLDIVGKTETMSATAHPSLTLSPQAPFMHHQAAVTLAGTGSRKLDDIEIVIDNALLTDIYRNSQTRDVIPEGDRNITFSATVPYNAAEEDLYDQAVAGASGIVAYTNGGLSLTFTFGALQVEPMSPTIPGRTGELKTQLNMVARKSGSTMELEVDCDSTA